VFKQEGGAVLCVRVRACALFLRWVDGFIGGHRMRRGGREGGRKGGRI